MALFVAFDFFVSFFLFDETDDVVVAVNAEVVEVDEIDLSFPAAIQYFK